MSSNRTTVAGEGREKGEVRFSVRLSFLAILISSSSALLLFIDISTFCANTTYPVEGENCPRFKSGMQLILNFAIRRQEGSILSASSFDFFQFVRHIFNLPVAVTRAPTFWMTSHIYRFGVSTCVRLAHAIVQNEWHRFVGRASNANTKMKE